jgi:hypothetical protein
VLRQIEHAKPHIDYSTPAQDYGPPPGPPSQNGRRTQGAETGDPDMAH